MLGSAWAIVDASILEGLEACREHLATLGGHTAAAGPTVRESHLEAFTDAFTEAFTEAFTDAVFTHVATRVGGRPGREVVDSLEDARLLDETTFEDDHVATASIIV